MTDTKQKLIDTALELVCKSSYGSVSVDDICKASDVKKGSRPDPFIPARKKSRRPHAADARLF
jgi:hypothetical protein